MHKISNNCRVCGYELDSPPWGEGGDEPTWDICPCCGTEFGYEDCTLESTRARREGWVSGGMRWFDRKKKPMDWSFEEQYKKISRNFL